MTRLSQIALERILPSPYNPRHAATGITELAASVKTIGVIEPIVVSVAEDGAHVHLVCGSRRFAAARIVGLKTVPAIVLPKMTERSERTISLVENLHRHELSHVEQGEAFRDLMATGLTQKQCAAHTGGSDFTVSTKVTIVTKLIPEYQRLLHQRVLSLAEATRLCKLPADAQRRELEGGAHRATHIPVKRRSKTELCLRNALDCYRAGNLDMALAEAERAVAFLRNKAVA